jgi:hypothetical protein
VCTAVAALWQCLGCYRLSDKLSFCSYVTASAFARLKFCFVCVLHTDLHTSRPVSGFTQNVHIYRSVNKIWHSIWRLFLYFRHSVIYFLFEYEPFRIYALHDFILEMLTSPCCLHAVILFAVSSLCFA